MKKAPTRRPAPIEKSDGHTGERAPLPRLDRITTAYQRLRELIIQGKLAPGSRIVELELAGRLGVSRTPIRSALQRLQQEGYVNVSSSAKQVRLWVSPLTREDARELFSIIGGIEGVAGRSAAELPRSARTRLLGELKGFNAELLETSKARQRQHQRIFELDLAFHRAYVEAGAGPRILALHEAIKPQGERYMRLYVSALTDEIGKSVDEHNVIIQSVADGDPNATQLAVQTNWSNAAQRLSYVIDSLGERGRW